VFEVVFERIIVNQWASEFEKKEVFRDDDSD